MHLRQERKAVKKKKGAGRSGREDAKQKEIKRRVEAKLKIKWTFKNTAAASPSSPGKVEFMRGGKWKND